MIRRSRRTLTSRGWLCLMLFGYAVLAVQTAWISDDAFISLRTVSNLLEGHGLRWNVDERVQSFTHPLWLFVLTIAHAVTGEPFYSTLSVSLIVSILAFALLLFVCPGGVGAKSLAAIVLVSSHAFVDFSSSGLENPLTHLLQVSFASVFLREQPPRQRALVLSGIAGVAALNRLDSALIFAPALAYDAWQSRTTRSWKLYLVGGIPLATWELFSLAYYGFPFPNTAYAKLTQDIGGAGKAWLDGFNYLRSSLASDPSTFIAIAGCITLGCVCRDRLRAPLLLGASAYLVYVVRIGGDFMVGRFISAPLFMCVICLASGTWLSSKLALATAAAVTIGFSFTGRYLPPPLTGVDFQLAPGEGETDQFGTHNERRFFFPMSSLRHADTINPLQPEHPWSQGGFKLRRIAEVDPSSRVHVVDAIGHAGYFAGARVHIIDRWALADALIARLPATSGRYGHFPRVIPDGYVETIATGRNAIEDPDLAAYYDELSRVIRGPIWTLERFQSIWRLNTGALDYRLDRYAYARGREVYVDLRVINPTDYSTVVTYVWDDYRTTSYVLDTESRRGKDYELTWQVTPHAATLVRPAGAHRTAFFSGLRDYGFFTVSIAFMPHLDGPIRDIHELRFSYSRDGDTFVVQRRPVPGWIQNIPEGTWHEGRAPGVLHRESLR